MPDSYVLVAAVLSERNAVVLVGIVVLDNRTFSISGIRRTVTFCVLFQQLIICLIIVKSVNPT